jgi:hypothetical protein
LVTRYKFLIIFGKFTEVLPFRQIWASESYSISLAVKPDTQSQPNLPLCKVSTAAYDDEQTHPWFIVIIVDHDIWPMDFIHNKKTDKKASDITIQFTLL